VPTLEYSLIVDGTPVPGNATNPVKSPTDIHTTVKGSDLFTLNAIIGAWVRPAPFLEIGASAQFLPSSIETKSTISASTVVEPTTVTFSRNGKPASDVTLSLPLPMTGRLGVRYIKQDGKREVFDVELDGVYETWSRVDHFRLDANNLIGLYRNQKVPVNIVDIQKQWQNTIGVHLGGDVNLVPDLLTARGGVYYETAVAKPAYSNVDFADGQHLGFALGGSVHVSKVEIAVAYEYRVQPTVRVSDANSQVFQQTPGSPCAPPYPATNCSVNYPGRPSPPVNGGEYFAYSHVMSLDGLYRF
jgi:hypothetical protein